MTQHAMTAPTLTADQRTGLLAEAGALIAECKVNCEPEYESEMM